MIAARTTLLLVALAACAWFVLGVRAADDQTRVTAIVNHHVSLTAAEAQSAERTLSEAQKLNPDETLNILRAQVVVRAGDATRAAAIVKGVVRREPQNVAAWAALELITLHTDPATNRLAQARVRALVPPVAPGP